MSLSEFVSFLLGKDLLNLDHILLPIVCPDYGFILIYESFTIKVRFGIYNTFFVQSSVPHCLVIFPGHGRGAQPFYGADEMGTCWVALKWDASCWVDKTA